MIANPAIPIPAASRTLNDLRMQCSVKEPSTNSVLILTGAVLVVVLAIGAFIWLDPLRLFTPTDASPPAPAFGSSAVPAPPTERQEIIGPLTPAPATKSVEVPIAPAVVGRAPGVE